MYDKGQHRYCVKVTISRVHNYLMHYKNGVATDSPYKDSFKSSLKNNISNTIKYLNKLL